MVFCSGLWSDIYRPHYYLKDHLKINHHWTKINVIIEMCDRLYSEQNTQNLSWLGFSCCLIDYQLQFATALFVSMHSDLSIFVNCFALNITRKIFQKCYSAVRCKLNLCVPSKTCMSLITRSALPLTENFQVNHFKWEKGKSVALMQDHVDSECFHQKFSNYSELC